MLPFSLSAPAPSGTAPAPALKVTTHLVVLSVVVTDKKGYPVTNLSQEDFKVFENEQAQAVATFEPASEPRIAEGKHPSPDLVPAVAMQNGAQPSTILVLDELNSWRRRDVRHSEGPEIPAGAAGGACAGYLFVFVE